MSDVHGHDLQAFDAMVPVILEAVPQEDILAAFTCYVEPVLSQAGDRQVVRIAIDEILHRHGVATPSL